MTFPELVAPTSQPNSESYTALPTHLPEPATAPQRWSATVASAKYHWYDLIAGFPQLPDIRDPIGRYLRRMQFDLEAGNEKRLIYCVVTRPRVRFDTGRGPQWGFFSLKLTLPLLLGADGKQDAITIELQPPFAATLKKPGITLTDEFITLNWGGLIEALSVHDVLQSYPNHLKLPSKVIHVGQTRDTGALLAKGRLPLLQKLHRQHNEHSDTLLLVQQMALQVESELGDPAELARNQQADAADALQRDRMDVLEAALIAHFEGPAPRTRNHEEKCLRNARLREAQMSSLLEELHIDLQLQDTGNYRYLCSEQVASARRHLLRCSIVEGEAVVTRLPLPPKT